VDRWQAIVEQLPLLRRYALSLTGRLNDADDLVQATAEKAYRKFSLFQRNRNIRPWLFGLLHNLYIDKWRHEQLNSNNEFADDDIQMCHPALQQDLYKALQSLPEEQRSVILLVDLAGFRYREVASILHIPEGTVMSRLSRARASMQKQLSSYNSDNIRKLPL